MADRMSERSVGLPQSAGDGWADRVAAATTDLRVGRPAMWAVLAMTAVAGVLTDLALRASDVGLASTILLVATCSGLVLTRRVVNRHAVAALGLAPRGGKRHLSMLAPPVRYRWSMPKKWMVDEAWMGMLWITPCSAVFGGMWRVRRGA
jgi:hypothetical protein